MHRVASRHVCHNGRLQDDALEQPRGGLVAPAAGPKAPPQKRVAESGWGLGHYLDVTLLERRLSRAADLWGCREVRKNLGGAAVGPDSYGNAKKNEVSLDVIAPTLSSLGSILLAGQLPSKLRKGVVAMKILSFVVTHPREGLALITGYPPR